MFRKILQLPFLILIRSYQYIISPMLGSNCRFMPSCSEYAHQAITTHGLFNGGALAFKRLCRCHPLAKYGFDPIPHTLKND